MTRRLTPLLFLLLASLVHPTFLKGQFYRIETDNVELIYTSPFQSYLVPQVVRTFENALLFHRELFDWEPGRKIDVLVHDLWHYGNAGARPLPQNHITVGISPNSHVYESSPTNERMTAAMNHEMAHLVTTDKASSSDRFFRSLFLGKVTPIAEEPVSMAYAYLTTPRWYTPRWYLEGIAVYLESWMNGGLGRVIGAYDEMVFRTLVRDNATIYDVVGLESEGTTIDFQVGVNSYLYGTRFVSYLAHEYGSEKVLEWYDRTEDSKRFFSKQFQHVFESPLDDEWSRWIDWEREWQRANLEAIRQNPTTDFRPVTEQALGSVSKAFFDAPTGKLLLALRYPGQLAHLASIDVESGALEKITDVTGAAGFQVTSLAYDAQGRTLFYTTNNKDWRHLLSVDLETGQSSTLMRDFRTGDLAFNPQDRSLWGVRHDNGFCTLVRIPEPYSEWNQIHTLPYGTELFDLDLSPDGSTLIASMSEVGGDQKLVRMDVADLLEEDTTIEVLFEFGSWAPANFVFSPDGGFLYGSSYYSGVSNIFRYDLTREVMEPLSNAETGFFKPVPISQDSLIAFNFTGRGFVPSMLPTQVPEFVSAIRFLGNEIANSQPLVRSWALPSSSLIELDEAATEAESYSSLGNLKLDSAYPIVEGYEDANGVTAVAPGLRLNMTDRVGTTALDLNASYSPDGDLDSDERLHLGLRFRHWDWELSATYNPADFYDLFGPTKTSRKGYSVALKYNDFLLFDDPERLSYSLRVAAYGGLETMPDFQNVRASFDQLFTFRAALDYQFLRKSLGAVEDELGLTWGVGVHGNYVNEKLLPRIFADLTKGFLLPLNHSSVWLRGSAGAALAGEVDEPFANFYFGGFGNNWLDYLDIKRFRDRDSFSGLEINQVGGKNYGKVQVEWVLPPIRFRRVGVPALYLRWASLSLYASGLATNLDHDDLRRTIANVGAQLDLRLVTVSHLNSTLSVGFALAAEEGRSTSPGLMVSLKIL